MSQKPNIYPHGLTEADALSLDVFFSQYPQQAWLYLVHIRSQPGNFNDLAHRLYFLRKDGWIAVYDTKLGGKNAWDLYDPQAATWYNSRELSERERIWSKGSADTAKRRARPAIGTEMGLPRRPGRPKGSKNKPKSPQAVHAASS